MESNNVQRDTFYKLLSQVKDRVSGLNKEIKELKRENLKLKSDLEKLQKEQNDIFSDISESDRIAMKHQVKSLIEKIENHVEGWYAID